MKETIWNPHAKERSWLQWLAHSRVRDFQSMGSAFRRRFFADADGGIASGAIDDPQQLAVLFEAWNARVKEDVPSDKLLVFSAKDGWGPLCAFLGVPVPSEPFPNVNDVDAFKLRIKQDWWHAAAIDAAALLGIACALSAVGVAVARRRVS